MKKRLLNHSKSIPIICLLLLTFSLQSRAQTLYDGLYNRPSYYPTWSQPTEWLNVMSYFVKVKLTEGSDYLSNYEVAVFDQNNTLRHCSRSIAEDDDVCTLTIPGEDGDTFHFQIIYGDIENPTIVDATQTVTFTSGEIIGTGTEPFVLSKQSRLKGDVNLDTFVNISDVTCLVNIILGKSPKTEPADVNEDGNVDITDVTTLVNIILGK